MAETAQRTIDAVDADGAPYRATLKAVRRARGWVYQRPAWVTNRGCFHPRADDALDELQKVVDRLSATSSRLES